MIEMREAILRSCGRDWLKVARVVYQARERLSLPDKDESYDLIAEQLTRLVQDGELEAVGDLSDWRASEVRQTGR